MSKENEKDNSKSKSKTDETETENEVKERWKLFSCLGYAAVMILIGLPIW